MFYVLDENNNKIEAFDKQGVLNAIETAIADGSLANLVADAAFVNKFKCCISGETHFMGFVTQSKYNEMLANGELPENSCLFITDDNETDCFQEHLEYLTDKINKLADGTEVVANARKVNNVIITNENDVLKFDDTTITTDSNGVLKINGFIIPQKKILFNGHQSIIKNTDTTIDLTESVQVGDVLEISAKVGRSTIADDTEYIYNAPNYIKFKVDKLGAKDYYPIMLSIPNMGNLPTVYVWFVDNKMYINCPNNYLNIYSIYKVIE